MSAISKRELRRRLEAQLDAGNWDAAGQTGIALADVGDVDSAEHALVRAAEQGHAASAFNLGRLMAMETRWSDAMRWYLQAAELGDPDGWIAAGNLAADTFSDFEQAAQFYVAAARAGDPSGLLNLGIDLVEQNRDDEAVAPLVEAANHGVSEAHVVLGHLFVKRGELEAALEHLGAAARDGERDAWAELGDVYQDIGEPDRARECYQRAIAAGDVGAYSALGSLFVGQGKPDSAERVYEQALKLGVDDVLLNYGNLLFDDGRTAEARKMYERAIGGGNMEGHANLGGVLEAAGELRAALDEYHAGALAGDSLAREGERRLAARLVDDEDGVRSGRKSRVSTSTSRLKLSSANPTALSVLPFGLAIAVLAIVGAGDTLIAVIAAALLAVAALTARL